MNNSDKKIFFWGMMGCGKSSLRQRLALELPAGWRSFDFDQRLVEEEGKSIQDLIDEFGWPWFRAREAKILKDLLSVPGPGLYSLGGGTLCDSVTDWPKVESYQDVHLVYLDTSLDECWSRVAGDKARPLVSLEKEYFFSLGKERLAYYKRAQHVLSLEQQNKLSFEDLNELIR